MGADGCSWLYTGIISHVEGSNKVEGMATTPLHDQVRRGRERGMREGRERGKKSEAVAVAVAVALPAPCPHVHHWAARH